VTTTKFDMAYGRQGGRVVAWIGNDPEPKRCTDCATLLLAVDVDRCANCAELPAASLFDEVAP